MVSYSLLIIANFGIFNFWFLTLCGPLASKHCAQGRCCLLELSLVCFVVLLYRLYDFVYGCLGEISWHSLPPLKERLPLHVHNCLLVMGTSESALLSFSRPFEICVKQ